MTIPETRSKSTKETVKKIENQLQNYIESNDSKNGGTGQEIGLVDGELVSNHDGILGSAQERDSSWIIQVVDHTRESTLIRVDHREVIIMLSMSFHILMEWTPVHG